MIVDDTSAAGLIYFQLRNTFKLNKQDGLFLYCGNLLVMCATDLKKLY